MEDPVDSLSKCDGFFEGIGGALRMPLLPPAQFLNETSRNCRAIAAPFEQVVEVLKALGGRASAIGECIGEVQAQVGAGLENNLAAFLSALRLYHQGYSNRYGG